MRVLFLDDMKTRHNRINIDLYNHLITHVFTADEAKKILDECEPFDLAMLDHDLAEEHYLALSEGLSEDPVHPPECPWHKDWHACTCGALEVKKLVGTGMDVVDHIVKMDPEKRPKRVLCHTMNPRGQEMKNRLKDAGVMADWVPFGKWVLR